MELSFDIRGYLKPYGKNNIDQNRFREEFVDPFDEESTRKKLYEGLSRYNDDLKNLLGNHRYAQWVDGSFISTKINPMDIDLVNLIDHQLVENFENELKNFVSRKGRELYGIDGYILRIYPEGHPKYVRTKSDLAYWENWFSKSKMTRRKQRFPKGFVELEF
jgi:hypothetical protein